MENRFTDTEFVEALRRLDKAATEATKAANGMRKGEKGCNRELDAAKQAFARLVLGRPLTLAELDVVGD